MDHLCSSRKDEYLVTDPIKEDGSSQEEPPLFLDFPSPFFDDISTIPILANNHSSPNKPLNITEPSPSETKPLKKRSVGKKDRHSKIHTAQGLRDRRMRLSLNIARKFFDLQDLLGFDKASKTIEWLFCKSNKAIKEVAENFNPDHTNQHMNEEIERMDSSLGTLKEMEIKNKESRKRIQNNSAIRETRDQARARARQRTRERMMINELEKSRFLFEGNPKDDIYKLGLGYLVSPDSQNIDEIGYKSSPSEPVQQETWSPSLEHSTTHHLLRELQLANINADSFENYAGCINVGAPITSCNTLFNHNPPAGWLNSSHGFLGIPGGLDADNFITESCNYEIVSNAPVTGDTYEQNPSSFFM